MPTNDYDIMEPERDDLDPKQPDEVAAPFCSADLEDHGEKSRGEEPALLCPEDFEDEEAGDKLTPPSFFVFSRLPTSPLDWRLTLVYSYLCSRVRYNRGASLRDIQAATGISRTTLTMLKNEDGSERHGLMRKLIEAGLVTLVDRQYFAVEPPEGIAKSLFYPRTGDAKHWSDRWAYFPFTKEPGWSTPVSLVYSKLVSMTTFSLTVRGLSKLLGISRDAVGDALQKLEKRYQKIAVHQVAGDNCSFFLLIRDYSDYFEDDAPEEAGEAEEDAETSVQVEQKSEKPKLSRYEKFVQFCKSKEKFPDYVISKLYEFENKLGYKRFNEIFTAAFEEHERKKRLDPEKYYGTCHALLLHRLSKEVGSEL
jgi:DNA-binding transcriptional regulator GbsR (MarR family)